MKVICLILLAVVASEAHLWAGIGGEIGNGLCAPFQNLIARFTGCYPINWNKLQLDQGISFSEPTATGKGPSAVSITSRSITEIRSLAELKDHCEKIYPQFEWSKTEVAGLSGYRARVHGDFVYFLFRSSGEMILIQKQEGSNADGRQQASVIMDSLHFN